MDAYYHAHQRIIVLVTELFAITQRAWGLGDPIHSFEAPAAAAIQLQPNSDPPAIVMMLKTPASYGEELELHSIRGIHHAFKGKHGAWEFRPFTPTTKARITLEFPLA